MVAEGEGRKDAATHRLSGRAPDNRLVHFQAPATEIRPGDVAPSRSPTPRRTTWSPTARAVVRRTRSGRRLGGAHRRARSAPVSGSGMPSIGPPPPVESQSPCG